MKKQSPEFYSAVIPINQLGQVLIGKRIEDGKFTTPAGGSNPGETPIKTAIRELFEESALVANPDSLIPLGPSLCGNGKQCYRFLYPCNMSETSSKLDPDNEVKIWKWTSISDLPNALREDKNRHQGILDAYKRFYGINKSLKDLMDKLEKGGEGSGIKGHMTSQLNNLANKLNTNNIYEKEYHKLTNGSTLEGAETKSGKPVYLDPHQAMAHGYSPQDYLDAANEFYNKADGLTRELDKQAMGGRKPEPSAVKVQTFHAKKVKSFMKMAERATRVEEEVKQINRDGKKSTTDKYKVKKSIVMMGHADAVEVDTAKFSQEDQASRTDGLRIQIESLMKDFNYGDVPREVSMTQGILKLVKVEDGIYSGMFTNVAMDEESETNLLDNAKVRIERMTIPSIVSFCIAKGWYSPVMPDNTPTPIQVEALNETLSEPQEAQQTNPQSNMDRKIQMLELITKLLG